MDPSGQSNDESQSDAYLFLLVFVILLFVVVVILLLVVLLVRLLCLLIRRDVCGPHLCQWRESK